MILHEGDGGELLAELVDDEDSLEQQEFLGAAHVLLLPGAGPTLVSQQPSPVVAFVTTCFILAVLSQLVSVWLFFLITFVSLVMSQLLLACFSKNRPLADSFIESRCQFIYRFVSRPLFM